MARGNKKRESIYVSNQRRRWPTATAKRKKMR